MKYYLCCVFIGEGGWENVSSNKVSNTSQPVMVPGSNEQYHSRAFPHRVCKNNQLLTFPSIRFKK
jgi:hypothetical protein